MGRLREWLRVQPLEEGMIVIPKHELVVTIPDNWVESAQNVTSVECSDCPSGETSFTTTIGYVDGATPDKVTISFDSGSTISLLSVFESPSHVERAYESFVFDAGFIIPQYKRTDSGELLMARLCDNDVGYEYTSDFGESISEEDFHAKTSN